MKPGYMPMRAAGDYLRELAQLLPENARLLELGSYAGESAEIFLRSGRVAEIVCVDPWENGYDYRDAASKRHPMRDVEAEFDRRLADFQDRVTKLRMKSDLAFDQLRDGPKFDAVYIDGLHTYSQVRRDVLHAHGVTCRPGFICGHDFNAAWPDVQRAVRTFFEPDLVYPDGNWIKQLV